jgi:predicted TIM-barrel fold metal-dependent hydrolase
MIIDAHVHAFEQMNGQLAAGPTRGLGYGMVSLGEAQSVRLLPPLSTTTTFTAEMLLNSMDWAGVDRAILLQGPFYGDLNDFVAQAVRRWPDRFVGAAYVDLWTDNARETFDYAIQELGLRIVKIPLCDRFGFANLYPQARLDDGDWMYEAMERLDIALTLDLGAINSQSYQTELVRDIATKHPELRIIVCHLGQPSLEMEHDNILQRNWEEQVLLAQHPNMWLDLSALPAYAHGESYPFPSVGRWLRRAVELVGSSKLLWGTDAPGLLTVASYPQLLTQMQSHLEFLPEAEVEGVLGLNALAAYKLD